MKEVFEITKNIGHILGKVSRFKSLKCLCLKVTKIQRFRILKKGHKLYGPEKVHPLK